MSSTSKQSFLRYTLGNSLAVLIGFFICFALLAHSELSMKQFDFLFYYSGSRAVLGGHGGQLYDLHALGRLESAIAYPLHVRDGGLPYVYPPHLALALAPLAALPYQAAYLFWLAVNAFVLASVMFCLERYARLQRRAATVFRLACFCSLPALVALFQGQTSILLLGLAALAFFALRSGRDAMAGAAVALLVIKPPYMVPYLVMFVAQRRWRALSGFAVVTGALLAIPALVLGPSIDLSYVNTLFQALGWHNNSVSGFDAQSNRGFAGFVELLFTTHLQRPVLILLDVLTLVLLARVARRSREVDRPFALAVLAALLIAPHVLVHDLTLLAIPAAVVVRYRDMGPRHSTALLASVYASIIVGFGLSYVAPIQLSVAAMLAMSFWIYRRPAAREPETTTPQTTPLQQPALG